MKGKYKLATKEDMERLKERIDKLPPDIVQQYHAQIQKMRENATAWRKANPDAVVNIQFNLSNFTVVMTISNAIKNGFVMVNDSGLEFIKAIWPWCNEREPTIAMIRTVIEGEGLQ